jgi:hypothetical protein
MRNDSYGKSKTFLPGRDASKNENQKISPTNSQLIALTIERTHVSIFFQSTIAFKLREDERGKLHVHLNVMSDKLTISRNGFLILVYLHV